MITPAKSRSRNSGLHNPTSLLSRRAAAMHDRGAVSPSPRYLLHARRPADPFHRRLKFAIRPHLRRHIQQHREIARRFQPQPYRRRSRLALEKLFQCRRAAPVPRPPPAGGVGSWVGGGRAPLAPACGAFFLAPPPLCFAFPFFFSR